MTKRNMATGLPAGESYGNRPWCFFYLHTNGTLIHKPKSYDHRDFEESDFVQCWWIVLMDTVSDPVKLLKSAMEAGAKNEAITTLLQRWNLPTELAQPILSKLMERREPKPVYIYCPLRQMYWNETRYGYTPDWQKAGLFPLAQAQRICSGPNVQDYIVQQVDVHTHNRPVL